LVEANAGKRGFVGIAHDTAITPSVSMLLRGTARQRSPAPDGLLLVDDPVYGLDDDRFGERKPGATRAPASSASPVTTLRGYSPGQRLLRLAGTHDEADAIASLVRDERLDRLQGFDATREGLLAADLSRYRYIHVASHAVSDSLIPQLSALILSTYDRRGQPIDGHVFAADLMQTQLGADAVVLSGCETALGKNVLGEGLIGLQYAVLARGAKSVISSLWKVPDRFTAGLMAPLYASLLHGHTSAVVALASAIRTRLSQGEADPALWGAFTVTIADLSPQRGSDSAFSTDIH